MVNKFSFLCSSNIRFGVGRWKELPGLINGYGSRALLITGGRSLVCSPRWEALLKELQARSITVHHRAASGEPSPETVDAISLDDSLNGIQVVIAIGGGSALDAGKAVSAMLPLKEGITPYLEGMPDGKTHPGTKLPLIAVPTTSGTGSEVTKNAVIGKVGPSGFKRSLRHDRFIPDIALVDPELTLGCPREVTASCGMDALTQLLESYLSSQANPFTDALAWSGMEAASRSLLRVLEAPQDIEARSDMSYAALISGITLANAGLGVVHGIASPMGGHFDIPHGVVCGALIASAMQVTLDKIISQHGWDHPALPRMAKVGCLLESGETPGDARINQAFLRDYSTKLPLILNDWAERLGLPCLSRYGIQENDLAMLAAKSGLKNHPIDLNQEEIREILRRRL